MRTLTALLAAALLIAAPLTAQDVRVDTIFVQVYGAPASIALDGPVEGYVGDTLRWTYTVLDEDGAETPALVSWALDSGGEIVEATDTSLAVVPSRPGQLRIIATIVKVDSLAIGTIYNSGQPFPEGTFRWGREGIPAYVGMEYDDFGEFVRFIPRVGGWLCAYFYTGSTIVATSQGEVCRTSPPVMDAGPTLVPSVRAAVLAHPGTWVAAKVSVTLEYPRRLVRVDPWAS